MLKQDYEIEQQEDEDLRCPVCNYYFSNIIKPYLLPCNHNLCLECIDNIMKKNMLYCPICRCKFNIEEREKFQVNFSFLSLVIKILKTKVIFCSKCSKVFNWSEHQGSCDQRQFKETNEVFGEVKMLIDECIKLLKSSNQYMNILDVSKRSIYNKLNDISKEINDAFGDKCQGIIEAFYKSIPQISIDIYYNGIINYLVLCEPLYNNMNVNTKDINDILVLHNKINKSEGIVHDIQHSHSNSNIMTKQNSLDNNSNKIIKVFTTKKAAKSPHIAHPFSVFRHIKMKSCNQCVLIKSCSNKSKDDKNKDLDTIEKNTFHFDIEEFLRDDDDDDNNKNNKDEDINIPQIKDTPLRKQNTTLMNQSVIERKIHEYQLIEKKSIGQVSNNNLSTTSFSTIVVNNPSQEDDSNDYFNKINKIIPLVNNIKDSIHKIQSYSRQIEFTTQTIKEQITSNFISQNNKIISNFSGVIDHIKLSDNFPSRKISINFIENTRKVWIYDITNNTVDTKELSFLKYKFNQSVAIEFDQCDTIYITGGKYNTSIFSDESTYDDKFYTIKWIVNNNNYIDKQNEEGSNNMKSYNEGYDFVGQMPRKRALHSSLYFNSKLYLIGGEGEKKTRLKECECYNTKDKRWELMPLLNYARINPSLCIYNNNYLYVFRGDTETISFIEFIRLDRYDSGWRLVIADDPGSVWIPTSLSSSTVISDNQIMICGGLNNSTMVSSSFIYDPIKKVVYRGKDICHSAIFSSTGIVHNNKLISIDIKNNTGKAFGVHMYDVINNNWSLI